MRSATRELGGLKVLSLSSVPSGSWGQQGLTPVSALSSDPSRPEPLLADQMEPEMERDHRQSWELEQLSYLLTPSTKLWVREARSCTLEQIKL